LRNGDHLPGLLGYEIDKAASDRPANTVVLAHSQALYNGAPSGSYADMTIYRAVSSALVWSAGTMQWSFGLSNSSPYNHGVPSHAAQQIMVNILDALIDPASVPQ